MSKKTVTHEPPKCPSCGANLFRVSVTEHLTYTFNPIMNSYSSDGSLKTKCVDCGADLYEVFPTGVCNYPIHDPMSKREGESSE